MPSHSLQCRALATLQRVKLTPLLSGDVQLGQVQQPIQFPGPGEVALYSDNSIVDIDRAERPSRRSTGGYWPYSKLIIATGSRAYVPPIPGADIPGVYTFRNFDDVEKLVARSFSSRRCVVVGGGLLGLEAARGMSDRGVETWVVEHEAYLMARQLDARGGELLGAAVERMGLHVLYRIRGWRRFQADSRLAKRRTCRATSTIDCDTVIICTGDQAEHGACPRRRTRGRARHQGRRDAANQRPRHLRHR